MDRLLAIDYGEPINLEAYLSTLSPEEWKALQRLCYTDLVQADLLYSDAKVLVSVFVRNLGNVFSKMNPINKFLVLFLYGTGFVTITDLYEKYAIDLTTHNQSPQDYEIMMTPRGSVLRFCKSHEEPPPSGTAWRHISNSSGTVRDYPEAFSTESGDIRGERARSGFNVFRKGTEELLLSSFQQLLLDKLSLLRLA